MTDLALQLLPVAVFTVVLAAAVWRFARRAPEESGPFPDVPDAPPTASPSEAPGMTLPYSSLDPYAPPKQVPDQQDTD